MENRYNPHEYHNCFDDKNFEGASVCGKLSILGDVDSIILNLSLDKKITFDSANELRSEIDKLTRLYRDKYNELVNTK
jgi:hypothetical protein